MNTDNIQALMALNYETQHDHIKEQMIIDFGGGNKIITDQNTQRGYKVWGNITKDSFSIKDMPIEDFESIIIGFGKQVQTQTLKH